MLQKIEQAKDFFLVGVLPELISKWYSREGIDLPACSTKSQINVSDDKCCSCNMDVNEDMKIP